MAIYPSARVRLLPENATQPRITPTQVIVHTAVDGERTTSLYDWFANGTNLESHFYVAKDGTVEQYMDTEVRADANNKANGRAVSIETWDGRASGGPSNRWTTEQARSLVDLIGWLCTTHRIPRVIAPRWDQPGLGWHNLHAEWSPGPTGCPGPMRAAQFRDELLPVLAGSTVPEEDDMPLTADDIEAIAKRVTAWLADPAYNPGTVIDGGARQALSRLDTAVNDPAAGIRTILAHADGSVPVDPSAIAAAVADSLPADLARQVADELARRLQG